ncbi:MAG: DMT family transporter [Alphaproteobacteria bacterium]|nr:DMT family transporter [Alphaproteobacteria bacterium]
MDEHKAKTEKIAGIVMLIISVMSFGAVDGFSKMLVDTQSFGQIMLTRYLPSFLAVLLVAGPGGWKGLFATRSPSMQILRGLTPILVGGPMVFAVRYLPLAEATVILFAGPFLVVVFSGIMLGERVSASSWIGVAIGFLAVVVVARPGFDALSVYAVFPATAAVFYALLQLLSRQLGTRGEETRTTLAWTLLVGTLVSLPLAVLDWQTPTAWQWLWMAGLGFTFGVGQYFLAKAFALAPANVLAPFSYFQILSAVAFGLIVFHDIPDLWTVTGIVMIMGAGIYVFGRNAPAKG